MMKKLSFLLIPVLFIFAGCASMQAYKDLNELEENIARGDPDNNIKVKEYLQGVLASPEGREVRACERRA